MTKPPQPVQVAVSIGGGVRVRPRDDVQLQVQAALLLWPGFLLLHATLAVPVITTGARLAERVRPSLLISLHPPRVEQRHE